MLKKILKFGLIFLIPLAIAVYINLWFYIDSELDKSLNNLKKEQGTLGSVSYNYETSGFPFSNNAKITNFKHKFVNQNLLSESTGSVSIGEYSGELVLESSIFSDSINITLPKKGDYYIEGADEKSNFTYKDEGNLEIFYSVSKFDLLLHSLGLKDFATKDYEEMWKGFTYKDNGSTMFNNGQVIAEFEPTTITIKFDRDGEEANLKLLLDMKNISLKDGYYDFYKKSLTNNFGSSEYEQKVIDYLLDFSRATGDMKILFDVDVNGSKLGNGSSMNKKGNFDVKIKNMKIVDGAGEFNITGNVKTKASKKGSPDMDINVKYYLENYEKVFIKYLTLFANLSGIISSQEMKDPTIGLAQAMMPKKNDILMLIPDFRTGLKSFASMIKANNQGNMTLDIVKPKESNEVKINNVSSMEMLMFAQQAFAPLMQKFQQIEQRKQQEMMKQMGQ